MLEVIVLISAAKVIIMCSSEKKDFDPSVFNPNIKQTVRELRVFFENILKSLCTTSMFKQRQYRKSLGDIRSLRNPDVEIHAVFDYEKDCYRHAYIFAYSIIHSLTTYDRFSDMLINNPTLMKRIATLKDIGLCIFGGGPAFEVVAISTLLSNVVAQLGPEGRDPLQLRVTVIDICTEWENEARCIIRSVQHEFKTRKNVNVNFSFIEADLTKDFSPDVVKAFKSAHFITMNKFLSDVQKSCGIKKAFRMIDELIETMSYQSCLFLLDFSGGGAFNKADKRMDTIPSISRIYGPKLHYCFKLKEETVEKFSVNTENIFPGLKCTPQSTTSCSVWVKLRNCKNSKTFPPCISASINPSLSKNKQIAIKEKQPKIKVKKEMQALKKYL